MPERGAPDARRKRSFRVVVRDESMLPALEPGDKLWVERRSAESPPLAEGSIVVARDPESRRRLLVKRVAFLGPGTVWSTRDGFAVGTAERPPLGAVEEWNVPKDSIMLLSDRSERSRDSRRFGPVHLGDVEGVAWFRYAPVLRRGPLAHASTAHPRS